MPKPLSRIILFIAFSFFCLKGFSQSNIKSFTPDSVKFAEEMEDFLSATDKKDAEKFFKEQFLPVWSGVKVSKTEFTPGKFTAAQKEDIYKTCNAMLKKRMKAYPDFKNYLTTLVSFANSSQSVASFAAWSSSTDKLLSSTNRQFENYINICNDLFRENALYISPSTHWYSNNNNYSFDFDSVPKVIFSGLNLTCSAKGDSMVVRETKGVYYPTRHTFYGDGGKVNWKRAGWDEDKVNGTLSRYSIDVSGTEFSADSAKLFNANYFKETLLGKYTDKLLANVTPENAIYPRFESYNTAFEIKNIVKDLDYSGGFSMKGSKMIGSGNADEDAKIIFHLNGKVFLVAASKGFVVRPERITSDNASVTIYWQKDSVYHPGLEFKYITKDRELALIRGENGKSTSPYYDSYHQLDMYFDAFYWKIDEPLINLKMISGVGQSKALFESSNYFREDRFLKMQGMSVEHPLYTVKKYGESIHSKVIYTKDLAKFMHLPESETRNMLLNLSTAGFVAFDMDNDKAVIKDRLYYYLLANIGKTDYDVIQFESVIQGKPNATINLLNFDLNINGVSQIFLSDSQNVYIVPRNQEVRVKKDRDFDFAGRVHAARLDFYGKEFDFSYLNFKVNLNNIDSLRIKVPGDEDDPMTGKKKLISVKSVLENITGDLLIDFQGNKSGFHKKDYKQYPIFNSKKNSYVFYDKPYIQNGVYKRDEFFFKLDPFHIDTLDNFSKEGLAFEGLMAPAGIFPDFRDTLKLMPDLSLGLNENTGSSGWPAYGGKGTYTNNVHLTHDGLRGDGTLVYLTSTTKSNDFIFLPDSMNTDALTFVNRKGVMGGVEFPAVKADSIYIHWMPKQDVMNIYKKVKNLDMYDGDAKLDGSLALQPKGMTGSGTMAFAASELEARLFKYKSNDFASDTADFRLTSDNTAALAFSTKSVQAHIDFTKRFGEFKANGGGSYVSFPLNQYICYIDQFKWFMDAKEIELSSSSTLNHVQGDTSAVGINLTGSEFISTEPHQDSLRFKAPFARYSLRDYLIKADQVVLVQSADAYISPDSGKVIVEKYAKMRTFNNARITANTTTKFHTITGATVDILGRKKYTGSGDYDYIDQAKIKHKIHFDEVGVDTTYQTIAKGDLEDTAGFSLSPEFLFKGSARLAAARQFLTFDGYAKMNVKCDQLERNWFRFNVEIDPNNINIPVSTPVSDGGAKLFTGIYQASDSARIYAAFLSLKNRANDQEIISATGNLTYDKPSNEFRIASPARAGEKPSLPGNELIFNDTKCTAYGEGKLNFGADLGQVKATFAGNVTKNLNSDSTNFDLMLALDFYFSDEAMKAMSDGLLSQPTLSPTQDIGRPTYEKGLAELVGKDKADKLISEMNLYGSFKKVPDDLRHTLFITDLKMIWNPNSRSYRSVGEVGMGMMDKTSLNRKVSGKVEILHKRTGDVLTIYLAPDKFTWYFFTYTRGLMQAISSDTKFNDEIGKVKPDKRISKGTKGEATYEYMLSTDRKVKDFIKKWEAPPVEEEENIEEKK